MKLPPISHTFHTNHAQCPRKAWNVHITRDLPKQPMTKAQDWGLHVHRALEQYINGGVVLPAELQHYEYLYRFPEGFKAQAEVQLGMRDDGSSCHFHAEDCWARGVIDIILTSTRSPTMALIIDHKTGKRREDPSELELHAVLLKALHPELTSIKGWYNWLAELRMGNVHDLSDTDITLARMRDTRRKIEHAYRLGEEAFPPRQGPLCGWCPVLNCEFHP